MRIRSIIKGFKPYSWEISPVEVIKKFSLTTDKIIRFDTNTMPFIPKEVVEEFKSTIQNIKINEYPDPSYIELREELSNYLKKDVDEICITAGCDEALDIVSKVFVEYGTSAIISSPTYAMYRIVVETMGGKIVEVLRKTDFSDDVEKLMNTVNEDTRIIFLCNPNNPTGNLTPKNDIISLVESFPEIPIVVDESYAEFAGESLVDFTDKYENLIILRTFSKALFLAGARVGYIVANAKTIQILNIMRPPNSLSVPSLILANIVLKHLDVVKRNIEYILSEREWLIKELKNVKGIQVYPSCTNFILVRFNEFNVYNIYESLLRRGVIVRNVSDMPMLKNCLRITVRTRKENSFLIENLKNICCG
ncbi:MAG: histidinol-phosphate transaminase [Candidatus Bathyarchaeota archaeon]